MVAKPLCSFFSLSEMTCAVPISNEINTAHQMVEVDKLYMLEVIPRSELSVAPSPRRIQIWRSAMAGHNISSVKYVINIQL